jgi:hypothetical protein
VLRYLELAHMRMGEVIGIELEKIEGPELTGIRGFEL